jgi:glycine cleavage system aminomethyltransferase T
LFDFSFMGHFELAGRNARGFLERLQTRSLASLAPGRATYTLLLRVDGTVFIDATVWCVAPDRYWLFTGRRSDFGVVAEAVREEGVNMRDLSGAYVVLALQGPASPRVLEQLLGTAPGLAYFAFRQATVGETPVVLGRLGYSGELGYELIVPSAAAPVLWQRFTARPEVRACGFDAANSLRIESGFILFANELAKPVTPFELGLERLVSFDQRPFVGAEALRPLRWRQPARRLVGIEVAGRCRGANVLARAEVTSRARSPIFGRELALGFVATEAAVPGALVALSGAEVGRVCRLPFYDPGRVLPRRST